MAVQTVAASGWIIDTRANCASLHNQLSKRLLLINVMSIYYNYTIFLDVYCIILYYI